MENYKIVIKPIKKKVKETDVPKEQHNPTGLCPVKLEAMKEKRKQQREERKANPKPPKEKKEKKTDENIIKIDETLKHLIGHTVNELNEKLHNLKGIQIGTQPTEIKIKNKKEKM